MTRVRGGSPRHRITPARVAAKLAEVRQSVVEQVHHGLERMVQRFQLDTPSAQQERVPQRSVFDVVPRHPETVVRALAKLDRLPNVTVQKLGEVDVPIRLHREVTATIKVKVVAEEPKS